MSLEVTRKNDRLFLLVPNSAQCQPSTYKNDIGVWPCSSCKVNVTMNNSVSFSCPQCLNRTACPVEVATEIYWPEDIEQNGIYPELPENDVFDDVIMTYMFQTDLNFKSPFFILMIVLSIVLIIAGLISFLKLSKRFTSNRQYLMKLLQHLDLIEQGQLWIGGLISIAILVLVIFASKFGDSYHYRYPIEKQICDANTAFSCDFDDFYNTKFDTSLQLLSSSTKQHKEMFGLLNSQEFTLNIEFINTLIHCGAVTLEYEKHIAFNPFSCYTNDRILYVSVKLPVHNLNLKLILFDNETIDAIRIHLTGLDAYLTDKYVQNLNFSKGFKRTDHFLSQNLVINLQLTKSINITEGLTDNDNTTYTSLWLPTFVYDTNQLFSRLNSSKSEPSTILLLPISESVFFIKNKQKPIARRSEIIFHIILFIGICIDLTCMMMFLLRVWFMPIMIFLIRKVFHPNSIIYRLIGAKKSSSEMMILNEKVNAQEIAMKKIQQQIKTMSKTIK